MNYTSAQPRCIGIIMDGNRRWAQQNRLPAIDGHKQGYKTLKECLGWVREAGIQYIIIYAFSTENWNRSMEEVSYLMRFMRTVFAGHLSDVQRQGVRIRFIGEREKFPEDIRDYMRATEEESSTNTTCTLGIALSYGGRAEIIAAIKKLSPDDIPALTEETFAKYLWTHDIPDPDLVIRTGGVQRLSNFLPWQSVYSEFYFTDTYWPAFSKEEFTKALGKFAAAKRNFGV